MGGVRLSRGKPLDISAGTLCILSLANILINSACNLAQKNYFSCLVNVSYTSGRGQAHCILITMDFSTTFGQLMFSRKPSILNEPKEVSFRYTKIYIFMFSRHSTRVKY